MTDREMELQQQIDAMQRVLRERGNAARGVTPKKAKDGYVVTDARDYREHYTANVYRDGLPQFDTDGTLLGYQRTLVRKESKSVQAYRVTLQTPYTVQLEHDAALALIESDLLEDKTTVLDELGVDEYTDDGEYHEDFDGCGLYRWQLHAAYKVGYWEVDLYLTAPVIVPEERSAAVQQTAKTRN